jgi:hypothetical protein
VNPEQNGTWVCTKDGHLLCGDEQRAVKDCHIFIPELVKLEQTDSDPVAGTVSYGDVVNGPGEVASTELQEYIK